MMNKRICKKISENRSTFSYCDNAKPRRCFKGTKVQINKIFKMYKKIITKQNKTNSKFESSKFVCTIYQNDQLVEQAITRFKTNYLNCPDTTLTLTTTMPKETFDMLNSWASSIHLHFDYAQ